MVSEEFIPDHNTDLHHCNYGRNSKGNAHSLQVGGEKEVTEGII